MPGVIFEKRCSRSTKGCKRLQLSSVSVPYYKQQATSDHEHALFSRRVRATEKRDNLFPGATFILLVFPIQDKYCVVKHRLNFSLPSVGTTGWLRLAVHLLCLDKSNLVRRCLGQMSSCKNILRGLVIRLQEPPVETELWRLTRDAVGRQTETLAEKIALTSGYFMAYSVLRT